jgi:hypothetical protein
VNRSISDSTLETGLFIIWETGRQFQDQILDDIAAHFHINRVTEFRWTPAMVWANYQRFYSDTQIRGSAQARNKGLGSFLAINVIVNSPTYDRRLTRNRGVRVVNTAMFDAKTRFREWTGGYGIHCGETLSENLRDTYMLYGPASDDWLERELPKWNGTIDILEQDPLGAHGWRSFDELFGVLNRAINYALIYYGPTEEAMDGLSRGHAFDILTSDYYAAHTILHSGQRIPEPLKRGGGIEIRVADKPVKLNLRYLGDGLFDESWATAILDDRVIDSHGFYRPKENEQYWLMAHRAVAQRAAIDHKIMLEFMSTAADQHMLTNSDLPTGDVDLKLLLTNQLIQRGLWRPGNGSRLGSTIGITISEFRQSYQILAARIRTLYFAARDTILAYFPILSSIKKTITQDTGAGKPW